MNGLDFKRIFIDIIFIKYYITQIKIFKVKVKQERPRKVKLDTYNGTEGVIKYLMIHAIVLPSIQFLKLIANVTLNLSLLLSSNA